MKITLVHEVEVSTQELFKEVKARLGWEDYVMSGGKVCSYERTGWNDYEWEPAKLSDERMQDLKRRYNLLQELIKELNACKNPYKEPDDIKFS